MTFQFAFAKYAIPLSRYISTSERTKPAIRLFSLMVERGQCGALVGNKYNQHARRLGLAGVLANDVVLATALKTALTDVVDLRFPPAFRLRANFTRKNKSEDVSIMMMRLGGSPRRVMYDLCS